MKRFYSKKIWEYLFDFFRIVKLIKIFMEKNYLSNFLRDDPT